MKGYKKQGETVTSVEVYNSIRLAETPKEVRDLIKSDAVKPTGVLPFLKGRSKAKDAKAFDANLIKQVQEMADARVKQAEFLTKSGFEGGTKLTKARTLKIVLDRISKGPALTDARLQAVKTVLDLVNQRASADEILASLTQEKPAKAPKAKKAAKKA